MRQWEAEIENIMLALNPPPSLPLWKQPGEEIGLTEIQYVYSGPARKIVIGWGIKPGGVLDFNDGQYLIAPAYAFAYTVVPETAAKTLYTFTYATRLANIILPTPMSYLSRGNVRAGRSKVAVTLNWGTFDTWIWAADQTAIEKAGLPAEPDTLTWEKKNGGFVLLVAGDANVGEIYQILPAEPMIGNLEMRYFG